MKGNWRGFFFFFFLRFAFFAGPHFISDKDMHKEQMKTMYRQKWISKCMPVCSFILFWFQREANRRSKEAGQENYYSSSVVCFKSRSIFKIRFSFYLALNTLQSGRSTEVFRKHHLSYLISNIFVVKRYQMFISPKKACIMITVCKL